MDLLPDQSIKLAEYGRWYLTRHELESLVVTRRREIHDRVRAQARPFRGSCVTLLSAIWRARDIVVAVRPEDNLPASVEGALHT